MTRFEVVVVVVVIVIGLMGRMDMEAQEADVSLGEAWRQMNTAVRG